MAAIVSVYFLRGRRNKRIGTAIEQPSPLARVLQLPLVTNTQSFYGLQLIRHDVLQLPLVTNSQTFYPITLTSAQGLALPLVTNSQTFYALELKRNVALPLVTNTQTFYSLTLTSAQNISLPLVVNSQTFHALTLNRTIALPLVTNTQTFYQMVASTGPVPGYLLTTPSVSVTSAAGAAPAVDLTINADHYAGYYLDIQRSTTGAKNVSDGSYTSPTLDISHQITPSEVAALAITNTGLAPDGYSDPAGVYFQQYRIRREDGALSQWVEISGNVTDSVAKLTTVNGPSKNSLCIVSAATPLAFRGTNGNGANMPVRATAGAADAVFQFEVTVTTVSGFLYFGLDDGTTNLNSGFPIPGRSNSAGLTFEVQPTNFIAAYWNSASNQVILQSTGTPIAVGDVFHVSVNQTTGAVQLRRTRGGVTQAFTAFTPGVGAAKLEYAWFGSNQAGAGTVNFGGSAFTYDDGSGIYA